MPVTSKHPQYLNWRERWQTLRDCKEDEAAIKAKGSRYLPKPSGQKDRPEAYAAYLARAVYTDVLGRTVSNSVGVVMRKDTLFDLPEQLKYLEKSATPSGQPLGLLIKQTITEQVTLARYGILVDRPGIGGQTRAVSYKAEQIINWQERVQNDQLVLSLVVLAETENVSTDPFTLELEPVFIVLSLDPDGFYTVSKWREDAKAKNVKGTEPTFIEEVLPRPTISGEPIPYIPFVFFGASHLNPAVDKPPLLGMANMSLALYRNSADREQALFLVGQPTPVVTGLEEQQDLMIGSAVAWLLPHGATASMLEISGAGMGAQREAMQDKTEAIAAMGARFLEGRKRNNIAAETVRLQQNSDLAVLMDIVGTATLGFEQLLQWVAAWEEVDGSDIKVHLNKDFAPEVMAPQMLSALGKARQSGDISKQTYHYNLEKGEIIRAGKSFEDEQADIAEQAPTFVT
jgi:hypothetical protein